jgi:CSLREA domain-containing protein
VRNRKRTSIVGLSLLLVACAGLAALMLLPGGGTSNAGRALSGKFTLAQAPASLRAAVQRDERESLAESKRWELHAAYQAGGVRLAGPGWSAQIGLGRVGRHGALVPVAGQVRRAALAALYGSPDLREAFTTGPLGVVQSLTVAKRPSGSGPLVLDFGVSGLRVTGAGRQLVLRGARGQALAAYRDLRVTDAAGDVLRASMRAGRGGRGILIEVADRHARYPLRVDPMFAVRTASAPALAAPARATMSASYGSSSVRLSGPKLSGTVGLGDVGRAGALSPVSSLISRSGEGARYGGSGITETFTQGMMGVEQSFRIDKRPAGSGPLLVKVGLSGLTATGSGDSLALHRASGAPVGTYGGLRVTDAGGRVVKASMSPAPGGRGVVISVDDRTARYPLVVDPTFVFLEEVASSAPGDDLGYAVSVSGSTAIVGAPNESGGGAAFILNLVNGGWVNAGILNLPASAPDGTSGFGSEVAISGSTAVVSASAGGVGAVYVYTLSQGSWIYANTELTAPDGAPGDNFGQSIATSGGVIAVGAPDHTVEATGYVGATYIYTLAEGTWFYTAELTPNDNEAFDESGSSVAISESGTTVVAGANDGGIPSAYVYTLSGGASPSWGQAQQLVAPNPTSSNGALSAVAISGSTIVLGGSEFVNSDTGQAYVYTNSGSGWDLAATLNPADSGGYFGTAVAISGGTIVVGAFGHSIPGPNNQPGPANEGAAYVFTGSGSNWTQQPTDLLDPQPTRGEEFGAAVAVSGSTILVGNRTPGGGVTGAYFFAPPAPQAGPTFTVTNTGDANDGACYVGNCSLRDAITAADAYPTADGEPKIAFDIPGGVVQTISPTSPLPTITTAMTIDGTTQTGYPGSFARPDFPGTNDSPVVDIDGSGCTPASTCDGLTITSPDTTVKGLAIEGFPASGILLSGGGGDTISEDWIGENPATQALDGNADFGIDISGSADNTIDGDLIAGNGGGALMNNNGANVMLAGGASFGNTLSLDDLTGDPNGPASGEDSQGIVIENGAGDNTIGGLGPDNDVINGYIDGGVELNSAGFSNTIEGDAIGLTGGANPHVPGDGGQGTGIEVADTSRTIIGDDPAPGAQADTAYGNEIGGNAQSGSDGIAINDDSQDTTVAGNYIGTDSAGDSGLGNAEGVAVGFGGATGNVIGPGNTIADSTGTGVEIDGGGNEVTANSIYGNGGPGIGGGFSGVPTPTLSASSTQTGSATAINGTVTGTAGLTVAVDLFDSPGCASGGEGETYLGTQDVTIGSGGTGTFSIATAKPSAGDSITATETTTIPGQTSPSTSAFSGCSTVETGADNDEWTNAQLITPNGSGAGSATGSIDLSGQARWYKVPISPGGSVTVNLTNLPADYNIALFSDISQAEASLTSNTSDEPTTENLQALQAEMPGNAFSPSVFSPSVFSPSVFSPSVFSPSVFSPSVFSPSVFSPSVFSPSVFSPSVFSPSVFSPSVVSPSVFSPSVFSPSVFSPSVFSPSTPILDAENYEDAQIEALLAVSDAGGDANQQVSADTWNNTGYFYIRVSGANGAYAPGQPFSLGVQVNSGTCGGVEPMDSTPLLSSSYTVPGPNYQTLILTDQSRMTDDGDLSTMETDLQTFAGQTSVNGTIVDVGSISPRVQQLQAQADQNADCVYAKNLVAEAIQKVVSAVRQANSGLKYIVIIGDDHVIPFFRYPDTAGLAPESGYVPPVLDTSASYASLESDDFLSQDAYGSSTVLSAGGEDIPVPDLPVGRLVETPTEIDGMLKAYMSLTGGVVSTPTSSLVTGYDFMTSSAKAVEGDLSAGLGAHGTNDTLITNDGVSPSNTGQPPTQSWTASQLETALLGKRHDLIYLAGHFSANNTLAADDSTTMNATQLASSNVNLENSIVFSPGCHSGYNIASEDAVPNVTQTTDWVGAFAQHQATLIAGTGYQYGDTDFLAYSDQLYADFAQQLLVGSGPVAVGTALTDAKSAYLDNTPDLQGIDIKAVLESTLYGLPMLSVNMPGGRTAAPTSASTVTSTTAASQDSPGSPGANLGLSSASLTLTPSLTSNTDQLQSTTGGAAPTATYLSGPNGVESSPAEPTLPLSVSDVSVSGQVLRGVGFTGGTYTDQSGITPLTGAPTSDLNSEHSTFSSNTFFPSQLFKVNYFGGLNGGAASTKLMLTPAQYESDAPGSLTDTQRSYSSVGLRLFYSDNTSTYGSNTPALAAPPSIGEVSATATAPSSADAADGSVTFQGHVDGDPSAGIQQVWVTYTDPPSSGTGYWQSLDLTQDSTDSTLWTGTLSGLTAAQISDLDFMVQAVNGVGLVGVDDNGGAYFQPGQIPPVLQSGSQALNPTTLTLDSPPTSGSYGSEASVSATLSDGAGLLAGQLVSFTIGDTTVEGETNNAGVATAQIPLDDLPGGSYSLTASYDGTATLAGSSTSGSKFTVNKLTTTVTLSGPSSLSPGASPTGITATLQSGGVGLSNYSIEFVLTPTGGTSGAAVVETALTALGGVAQLPSISSLSAGGTYSVSAFFGSGGPLSAPADPIFANSTVAKPLPLTVGVVGQAPAFTSAASATFTVGSAGSFAITTTGVPANTISVGTGSGCKALPTGLALSGMGNDVTLSGTPAAGTAGTYAVCLTASNGVGTAATQAFTLTVSQAKQSITPSVAPVSAAIGGASYRPSATASSGLPVAISLDASSTGCSFSGGVVSFTGIGTCVIDFNQAGNGTYAAASQQQSIPVALVTEVDDAPSSTVTYTGSGWSWTHGQTGCQNFDCTESFSLTAGNTAQLSFTGTGVQWIAPKSNNGGYANVYVDGTLVASNVTTYAAATTYQQVIWSDQGLSNGPHTVKIVVLGTKPAASINTYVQIDAFIVTAAQKLNQSIAVTSTAPASPVAAIAGGPTYIPTATASSGLPVVVSLDGSSTGCSLSSGVVSFTGVGTCVIDFNQAGNGIYAAAVQQQQVRIGSLEVDDAPGSAVSYTGLGWTHGPTGCVNIDCTESFSLTAGNTAQFTFTGTGVEWIAPKSSNGGYANVYVDGTLVASNVTTYAATTTYQQVIWSDQGLSNGPHTLKIVVLGTKPAASSNTYVQIDAFIAT